MKTIFAKSYLILIFFIWVFPNHGVIDPIGSQWFYLSIINLIGIIYLAGDYFNKKTQINFNLVPVWSILALSIWALGSYFYALNKQEVLIESFRLLTLFSTFVVAAYFISALTDAIRFISTLFVISLVFEVLIFLLPTLDFFFENGYITRGSVSKGISSNVNIASFSMLYKVPLCIYVLKNVRSNWIKGFGALLITSTIFSITLLATRGAILGVFAVGLFYLIELLIKKQGSLIKSFSVFYVLPVLVSFFLNQTFITNELKVTERVSTISKLTADQSINQRLGYYKFSLENLMDNPLFGFGFGNWKLESIPTHLDRQISYIVPYHSHNDFLQIGAELGIIGLVLYVLFFSSILKTTISKIRKDQTLGDFSFATLLFFIVYLIDANLNFPIARPIIQIPLLILSGLMIKDQLFLKPKTIPNQPIKSNRLHGILLLFLFAAQPILVYSNARVFGSFIEQRKLLNDFNNFSFIGDLDEIETYESDYPNIGATTLPLKTMKALYFVNKDNEKSISLAKSAINDNPYLFVSESLLGMLYANTNQLDSAKYYAKKAYTNAPTIDLHAATYLPFITEENDLEALDKIKASLSKSDSPYIWKRYIQTLLYLKDTLNNDDIGLIDFAAKKFPNTEFFQSINKTKDYNKANILAADSIANTALKYFKIKEYDLAIAGYKKAAALAPFEPAYVENIARSYMLSDQNEMAIANFQVLINEFKNNTGLPEYYIGAIYHKVGDSEKGCKFLLKAMDKNFSRAKNLYSKLCYKK